MYYSKIIQLNNKTENANTYVNEGTCRGIITHAKISWNEGSHFPKNKTLFVTISVTDDEQKQMQFPIRLPLDFEEGSFLSIFLKSISRESLLESKFETVHLIGISVIVQIENLVVEDNKYSEMKIVSTEKTEHVQTHAINWLESGKRGEEHGA